MIGRASLTSLTRPLQIPSQLPSRCIRLQSIGNWKGIDPKSRIFSQGSSAVEHQCRTRCAVLMGYPAIPVSLPFGSFNSKGYRGQNSKETISETKKKQDFKTNTQIGFVWQGWDKKARAGSAGMFKDRQRPAYLSESGPLFFQSVSDVISLGSVMLMLPFLFV